MSLKLVKDWMQTLWLSPSPGIYRHFGMLKQIQQITLLFLHAILRPDLKELFSERCFALCRMQKQFLVLQHLVEVLQMGLSLLCFRLMRAHF